MIALFGNGANFMIGKRRLNTPAKRFGALVLVAGVALATLGLAQFSWTYSPANTAARAFQHGPFWALRYSGESFDATGGLLLWIGLVVSVVGLFTSYLYDHTVGRVVHWVHTGSIEVVTSTPPNGIPATHVQAMASSSRNSRSAFVDILGTITLALLQSWLTAAMGFLFGIMYFEKESEMILAPAGIATFFWFQSMMRSGIAGQAGSAGSALGLLGIKLVIGYLFFGIGVISAAKGLIR